MTAGLFKSGYELWRKTETTNSFGETILEWNKLADVKGRAYPITSALKRSGPLAYGEIQYVFATSPDVDIQATDEIRFNGRRLSVDVVPETSTGRRIEAKCRELPDA